MMFAFFDVDETLISVKSMFDFYDYYLVAAGLSEQEQREHAARARALLGPGVPRLEANRLFYQRFAGCKAAEVAEIGRAWFADHQRRGGLFHTDVLAALREHQAAGARVVFLSGSFRAVLDPIAEHCGADLVCCTELEVRDGILTGAITRPMIGDAKADAARELLAGTNAAADSHAYGDHSSDLGLLRLVGHPVVVGPDPQMAAVAAEHGWRRLAGIPG
jgi:HAD superfamily hydrolase (TIGR01490 family)